jgi:hypothetical protein
VYVGLENEDRIVAIDTLTNKVIATSPIGQAAQAVTYVPGAVPQGDGTMGLQPLGKARGAVHLTLVPAANTGTGNTRAPTSVSLFDQGYTQVLQASATGLDPKRPYVLALASEPDGSGALEPLAAFVTNPAGSAIVNALGPIRQVVQATSNAQRRYLVIAAGTTERLGAPVQVQGR